MRDESTPLKAYLPFPLRFSRRLAACAAAVLAAATTTAGYAFAGTQRPSIGTGIVVVDTNLAYAGGEGAGTGMVLTSSGEILTNNHVIRGATTITIVIPGTGHRYAARVVGYDVKDDVAVLQARSASHLQTVRLGSSKGLRVGQAVKAIGNAGGGGSLVTSAGKITGLSRTITVNDESGGTSTLRNLIETNAELEPGDSGGPLLNTAGAVVGMDSAASVTGRYRTIASTDGFAIPIDRALGLARTIMAGKASWTIHIGSTAFLGISSVSPDDLPAYGYDRPGAAVASVVPGSAADDAGLVPGDLITAVGGTKVGTPAALGAVILTRKPGARITVTYVDSAGDPQAVSVTLGSGPPQ
jgi:S1-C subfamily serine protease